MAFLLFKKYTASTAELNPSNQILTNRSETKAYCIPVQAATGRAIFASFDFREPMTDQCDLESNLSDLNKILRRRSLV